MPIIEQFTPIDLSYVEEKKTYDDFWGNPSLLTLNWAINFPVRSQSLMMSS